MHLRPVGAEGDVVLPLPLIGPADRVALAEGDGRDLLRLDARTVWSHSVYGADADHLATTARISVALPVMRIMSVGGDVGLTVRRSSYRNMPSVTKRIPQVRAYLVWSPS